VRLRQSTSLGFTDPDADVACKRHDLLLLLFSFRSKQKLHNHLCADHHIQLLHFNAMTKNASRPIGWHPPTPSRPQRCPRPPPLPPPPPIRTTTSHVFFTRHIDAASGPADKLAPVARGSQPVQPKDAHTNITAVTPDLAQAGLASSATTGLSHAAQLGTENHEVASHSPTACFEGIPTELHCMIFEYLWTPTVNIYVLSPRFSPPKVNAVHPIFNVSRHIRSQAIDSLQRNKPLTFAFHTSIDDRDFRKLARMIEDLDNTSNYFKESDNSKKRLQVHLHLDFRNAYRQTLAPGGFANFIACLRKLGPEAEYEYTFTDRDGLLRVADFARPMIVNRIVRLIDMSDDRSSLNGRRAKRAADKMRLP
jgi:hypothetical protein